MGTYEYKGYNINLIGHDSIKITTPQGKIIYLDPFAYPEKNYEDKADYVLISHEHFDHCSPEVLKKICESNTIIIAPHQCESKLENIPGKKILVNAENKLNLDDFEVLVVHAYNTNKKFHPKGMGNGYVLRFKDFSIYHPGDTDRVEEMKKLEGIVDVLLLPISGVYVMDENEAIEVIKDIKPKVVIPMHYNYLEGLEKDPQEFKNKVEERFSNIDVVILI